MGLSALVSDAAPLRRAVAAVAGQLVRTQAWEQLGFARLRDYAVERGGISARQLQELAHVDEALAGLPYIDQAMSAGCLSWTKARLLCRVAKPDDELRWLAMAARMSAQALSREVRAVDSRALERSGLEAQAGAHRFPRETVFMHCSRQTKSKWFAARQLAQRVAGERMKPWGVAEAIAAEVVSSIGLDATPHSSDGGRLETPEAPTGRAHTGPDDWGDPWHETAATPPRVEIARPPSSMLAPFFDGLEAADAFALDSRLRRALRLEQQFLARVGPMLLTVATERLYRTIGHRSFDAYVREELGMAASWARALLRIERMAAVSPAFASAWREGRLSWTQAEALAPLVAEPEAEAFHRAWLARAEAVTVRRLSDDVDAALATGDLDPAALPPLPVDLCSAPSGLQTGAHPTAWQDSGQLWFTGPREVARLFRAVLSSVQRRIERHSGRTSNENEALDAMLEHVFEAWGRGRPVPKKYRLFARDGWRCTVPGCTSYRNLQGHHIEFRSRGGSDELSNLTTLCAYHHLRGIHGGTVECWGEAPQSLHFALGVRSGGEPVESFRSGDVRASYTS